MFKNFLGLALVIGLSFANTLSDIQQKGEIRIGVWTNQPPYSNYNNGKFEGFEVEMANSIGEGIVGKNGIIILVPISEGSQRIDYLKENKVDLVIASFTETDERKKQIDFSLPYFSVAMGALSSSSDPIELESDLSGKTIVIQSGTTMEDYVRKLRDIKLIRTEGSLEAFKLLREGGADAYIDDNLVTMAYGIVDRSFVVPLRMRNLGFNSTLGVGVDKNNKELLEAVNDEMIILSKKDFFKNVFNETFVPFYKGEIEAKYFLLEDIYKIFG